MTLVAIGSRCITVGRAAARWVVLHVPVVGTVAAWLLAAVGARTVGERVLRLRDGAVTVPVPGVSPGGPRLRMILHGGRDQTASALATEGWSAVEPPLPAVLADEVRSGGGVVVDVGANTGLYALVAALADPTVMVHAFEPLPTVRAVLEANRRLNHLHGRLAIHAAAVGAVEGRALLHVPVPQLDGTLETSASLSEDFKSEHGAPIEVPVVTLDGWFEEQGRPRVTVIKIDVESREIDVLRGARGLLARRRPVVFYELLPQGDAEGIAALAAELRLVDVRLRPASLVVGAPVAFDPEAWNHALVPEERVDAWLASRSAAGLAVEPSP